MIIKQSLETEAEIHLFIGIIKSKVLFCDVNCSVLLQLNSLNRSNINLSYTAECCSTHRLKQIPEFISDLIWHSLSKSFNFRLSKEATKNIRHTD